MAPAPSQKPFGYESRSLRLPFFSLALPFLWSERPSLFVLLSPVRAPPASFMRPLALSHRPLVLVLPAAPAGHDYFLLRKFVNNCYIYNRMVNKGGCHRSPFPSISYRASEELNLGDLYALAPSRYNGGRRARLPWRGDS